ncbi:MAG TPA: peptide chain release factor N(5)-glutamine methyltransferase [Pyrinomonadaceae bacterium]|nr:peptide chain release factor N(5)-glutamine methyltransferase [Pyrinomonadaceae bacterium]
MSLKRGITVQNALAEATAALAKSEQARLEAGSLLSHIMNRDRTFILAHPEHVLDPDQLGMFQLLVVRRAAGEPLQYLTGHQEFFKLDFEVTPEVLIPRPESEAIVEVALELLAKDRLSRLVDVGTGSGCLAISILHELPNAKGIAIDVSPAALNVARRNAQTHRVADRLQLIESDLLTAIPRDEQFDLIVSNPPYVPDDDIDSLQREVGYEPRSALAGGTDGLDVIRRLLREAPPRIQTGGHLVFEFGFGQAELLLNLIDRKVWNLIEARKDLQGIPRTMVLERI